MPDRTRPIRKEICLNEQELNLIQHKMRQLGTHNFGAYARKMLIDGYNGLEDTSLWYDTDTKNTTSAKDCGRLLERTKNI